jgi:hypothetical protein
MSKPITERKIIDLAYQFMASKTLLSAIELGLFTELAKGRLKLPEIERRLGLHPRSSRDFLDTLVALKMLKRSGKTYSNTRETDLFLDRAKNSYYGGWPEMMSARLYPFWGSLTEALRTGQPQNEIKTGGNFFDVLFSDPSRLREFLRSMTAQTRPAARAMAAKFPWRDHKTFIDVGAAEGGLPVEIALANPHLTGGGFDLPVVEPVFNEYVASFQLQDRLSFHPGDFFKDPLPPAGVLVMGHILHDWDLEAKRTLLKKSYDVLPTGGALIVLEHLIDDKRKKNLNALLMSLNMLIETAGGFDYTGADCSGWMRDAGFRETRVEHLDGDQWMVVGVK